MESIKRKTRMIKPTVCEVQFGLRIRSSGAGGAQYHLVSWSRERASVFGWVLNCRVFFWVSKVDYRCDPIMVLTLFVVG